MRSDKESVARCDTFVVVVHHADSVGYQLSENLARCTVDTGTLKHFDQDPRTESDSD